MVSTAMHGLMFRGGSWLVLQLGSWELPDVPLINRFSSESVYMETVEKASELALLLFYSSGAHLNRGRKGASFVEVYHQLRLKRE